MTCVSPMAHRRKANLYFGSHKDCFVHGIPREWSSWLKYSKDSLNIVCLAFSNNFKLYTTFSSRPVLPSNRTKNAKDLQTSEYLEIDPDYAACLNIREGEMVTVECIPEVPSCTTLVLSARDECDHEVLDFNAEKIAYDMLDQVRVVSCTRPFPIWINGQPVALKPVRSEPPATWVLIEKKTCIDVQQPKNSSSIRTPSLTPSLPTSPIPSRTDSQDSAESSQTSSTNTFFSSVSQMSKSVQVTQPKEQSKGTVGGDGYSGDRRIHHRLSNSDVSEGFFCLPGEEDEDIPSEDSSVVSTIKNFFNLFRGPSPNEESTNGHQPLKLQKSYKGNFQEDGSRLFTKARISPSKSFTYGAKHSKTPSWHGSTEHEWQKEPHLKEIATPILLAPLRIQHTDLEKLKVIWDIHHYNDIFVHPLTLPDLYQEHKGKESYLVTLSLPVQPHDAAPKENGGGDLKLSQVASMVSSNVPTPGGKQTATTPLPEKPTTDNRGVLNKVVSRLNELSEAGSSTPPISTPSPVPSQPSQESCLTKTVVCHLQFATAIKFNSKRKHSSTATLEEVSISREGSSSPTLGSSPAKPSKPLCFLPVLPQHVVISDLIRQQLGVGAGSSVILRHCEAGWRVDCHRSRVSLYLQPVVKPANRVGGSRRDSQISHDIRRGFRSWVSKCCDTGENPYGCVFAEDMVIPLAPYWKTGTGPAALISCTSEDNVLCRVSCRVEKPVSISRGRGEMVFEPPLKVFTITESDLRKETKEVGNGIEIHPVLRKPDDNSSEKRCFPSVKDLDPPKVDMSIDQFGGMDELFSTGYQVALGLLENTPGGVMLICGVGGGGGVGGCGKTSLANLLCKELLESHFKAHVVSLSCTMLRGKRYESIEKKFGDILTEAIRYQPGVILLDDLDHCAQHITDVQREATGEGIMNTRTAQVFLDMVAELRQRLAKVIVIATATNKSLLHPSLLQSKGKHVFTETVEILPPNLIVRQEILQSILQNSTVASVLSNDDIRKVCLRTEGYQAIDIKVLVDRAISCAEHRFLLSSLQSWDMRDDVSPYVTFNNSATGITTSISDITTETLSVQLEDFSSALDSHVPASLRGLSLHRSGSITFKSVGGLEEAKKTLQETLHWPSKYPCLFQASPIKQHAGVLLYGAPGTGKTLLAGAVASEFGLNFVSIKGPELLNKFIGASEQSVRDLFTRAQAARPCILFFDEFDSLAPRRGQDRTGVTDRVVNQILTQLDGVEALEGVYVLAASSRPDLIDPALLRPGRIDKILLCNMPSEEDRKQILIALARDLPLSADVDFKIIASRTTKFTGADLKALLYNAQLLQVRRTLDKREKRANSDQTEDRERIEPRDLISPESSGKQTPVNDRKQFQSDNNRQTGTGTGTTHSIRKTSNVWQFTYNQQTMAVEKIIQPNTTQSKNQQTLGDSKDRERERIEITQSDLLTSLESTMPSLSDKERQKYEKIFEKFLGKSKTSIGDFNPRATLA